MKFYEHSAYLASFNLFLRSGKALRVASVFVFPIFTAHCMPIHHHYRLHHLDVCTYLQIKEKLEWQKTPGSLAVDPSGTKDLNKHHYHLR